MSTPVDTPKPDSPDHGEHSVADLHRPHMAEMNDPVMTATGLPDEEPDTIQGMLEVLARENAEPRDGFEPVPFWVSMVFGGLLAWGGYYVGSGSADFRRDVYDMSDARPAAVQVPDPDPKTVDDLKKIGEQKYNTICASCHKPNGAGDPSQNIPPLDGSEWVVGNQASPARLSRILLYGLAGDIVVKGRTYKGVMPNQGNILKDYEIAAVLTYVRNSWSNKADPDNAKPAITPAVVKAARTAEGARKPNGTQPVTADELLKLRLDHSDTGPAPK